MPARPLPEETAGRPAAATLSSGWGVPPGAAVAAVVLCLAAVLGLLGRSVWNGREVDGVLVAAGSTAVPSAQPAAGQLPSTARSPGPGAPVPADSPPPVTAGPAASQAGEVLVHVIGAVKKAGVVTLAAGARVLDAVDAAGGPSQNADLSLLNLARPVVDGEQIRVPRHGETAPPVAGSGGGPSGSVGGSTSAQGSTGGPINLNTADEAALDTLPGVGPVLAGRIVQWRNQNGRFTSVDELAEVAGIGERVLAGLRDLVTV